MTETSRLTIDFAARRPEQFARVLAQEQPDDSARLIASLPPAHCAAVVSRLPATHLDALFREDPLAARKWLERGPFEEAVNLLNRLPQGLRAANIEAVRQGDRRQQLLRQQRYPRHCIGSIVSDLALRIGTEQPAAEVLAELRETRPEDPGSMIMVDAAGRYAGLVNRWRLMLADEVTGPMSQYLVEVPPIQPETPIAEVAGRADWHARNWLAVVDHDGFVLGGVSREAVFQAVATGDGGQRASGDLLLTLLRDATFVLMKLLAAAPGPRRSP